MVWRIVKRWTQFGALGLAAVVLLLLPSYGNAKDPAAAQKQKASVYVCSCLDSSSCPCLTEAMREGPCACGTKGGPPMRRVDANSNWAKFNRQRMSGK